MLTGHAFIASDDIVLSKTGSGDPAERRERLMRCRPTEASSLGRCTEFDGHRPQNRIDEEESTGAAVVWH
jgi:hypothetical protein